MTVRTRFAPSPTGFMHIGGMRTALFNWLWARSQGGQFVLRIDDTDRERHVEEALNPILDAFRWLGLDWDEGPEVGGPYGPYFQSERGELYSSALQQLLDEGKAFRDFDPPELTRADREAAEKEKRNYQNIRRSLELSDADVRAKIDAGDRFVVRLLLPREDAKSVTINDIVRGEVSWNVSEMPDPVIARGDGSALYNFATTIDDGLMGITHVVRAEEHLSNTPIQCMIYEALGKASPTFAHVPFMTAPGQNKKLGKRDLDKLRNNPQMRHLFADGEAILEQLGIEADDAHSPVSVAFYETLGYLPQGLLNGLSRFGWAFDDKTELMSREFLIKNFDLHKVVKKPAGFDPEKLMSYQSHWMNELSREERISGCLRFLVDAGMASDSDREKVARVTEAVGERLRIFGDILAFDEFFVSDDELTWDEKAFNKRILKDSNAIERLKAFSTKLQTLDDFTASSLEQLMKDWCEAEEIKLGDVIHAVRVATTGKPKGVGMFEALELIGKASCVRRIDRAVAHADSLSS